MVLPPMSQSLAVGIVSLGPSGTVGMSLLVCFVYSLYVSLGMFQVESVCLSWYVSCRVGMSLLVCLV